jgi:hypothetical protein
LSENGREAVRNGGSVRNKAVTEISIPKSGLSYGHVRMNGIVETLHTKTSKPDVGDKDVVEEDTDQAGRAASDRDSPKGKGDPVAAVGVYYLRERRSAGGTIKKGNALDVSP